MQKILRILSIMLVMLTSCKSSRERATEYVKEAQTKELRNENKEAFELYNKAIAVDPSFAPAWYYRGNNLFNKNDINGAIANYSKAIDLKPDFADAYANRGEAYFSEGQRDKACLDYQKAEKLGKANMYEKTKWCK
jgi:tetratricopeptide (TPR) repeat protein